VVNRNGLLTGKNHFETPEMMELRLKNEGVMVENDAIVNWEAIFWDPTTELGTYFY
jgi:methylated-DNA-protein-cysteine methyltransferase-like protein